MLTFIKSKYKDWKNARFLKKHGCATWEQYHHGFDPDRNIVASRVADFYFGYPYWHVVENRDHYMYRLLYDYGPGGYRYGYHDVVDWCKENIKHKHRTDLLRAMKYPSTSDQWEINELGGGDYLFFAFKNERDYLWFLMRWS
jgi:hypothetical protein